MSPQSQFRFVLQNVLLFAVAALGILGMLAVAEAIRNGSLNQILGGIQ